MLSLPMPFARRSAEGVAALTRTRITALHDHHASIAVDPDEPLSVGDAVGVHVVHSCTTFDRWAAVVIADADDRVVRVEPTYF